MVQADSVDVSKEDCSIILTVILGKVFKIPIDISGMGTFSSIFILVYIFKMVYHFDISLENVLRYSAGMIKKERIHSFSRKCLAIT